MVGFLLRWLAALVLVFATYNPTQWNFVRWVQGNWSENLPMISLSGLLLAIGYIIYLRATLRSIGPFGILLVAAVIGAFLWVLIDNGILSLENTTMMTWIGLVALSFILAVGLSWSIFRRIITGQADIDDVDE
jgi:hypothetical protein